MKKSICWVIHSGDNPTTDFYIKPMLESGDWDVEYINSTVSPPSGESYPDRLVFVRYIKLKWARWINRNRDKIDQVELFFDDDLFDLASYRDLPWGYRIKLFFGSYVYHKWLVTNDVKVLVSTEFLLKKYSHWSPKLLLPVNSHRTIQEKHIFFYHGSYSHYKEMVWLKPVVEMVLSRDRSLQFEVIGDHRVREIFSGLDRVTVIHPMSWASYKNLLSTGSRIVGLAPLIEGSFNHARSYTKFYDISAAGAVGVYANSHVYKSIVKDGYNGLLVNMEQEAWAEAILKLSNDPSLRANFLNNARGGQ